ncbi:hypothetical protein [Methyloglobulus sp.]|uniref:hypothetical protein n=1 Tax=Methyloglobulus sp. TaxID=2518622 RepID=UPI003989820F
MGGQRGNTDELGQPQGRNAALVRRHPVDAPKPLDQGQFGVVEQGAGGHRGMTVATGAFTNVPGLQRPAFLMATTPATEAISPPQFNNGLKTVPFTRKVLLPFPKTRGFCLHNGSPGHQFKIWV